MIVDVAHTPISLTAQDIVSVMLQMPASQYPVLLDSGHYQDYGLYTGRYLIAAYRPETCLQLEGEPLQRLDKLWAAWQISDSLKGNANIDNGLPCAYGAAIGFCAYDLGRQLEKLPHTAKSSHSVPDLWLCFYTELIVYDYLRQQATLIAVSHQSDCAKQCLESAYQEWQQLAQQVRPSQIVPAQSQAPIKYASNFTHTEYLAAVVQIKEQIRLGNIYQANLTQQLTFELKDLPAALIFQRLRSQNPVAFMTYLQTPDWAVVSASPERFLARTGANTIAAYPIKGTRPRGQSDREDLEIAQQLSTSEKDIAENIMIVDLLRNDLGRICEIGSIDASQLLSLQKLPTVFHLVSKISGQLKLPLTISELLQATFPCGSITGAPKIRAMEIIEQIEGVRRGLSMGALGWFGYDGQLHLNVAIRTLFMRNSYGYFNVGGGIVADSDPESEYQESWLKAQAMCQAIGC